MKFTRSKMLRYMKTFQRFNYVAFFAVFGSALYFGDKDKEEEKQKFLSQYADAVVPSVDGATKPTNATVPTSPAVTTTAQTTPVATTTVQTSPAATEIINSTNINPATTTTTNSSSNSYFGWFTKK